MNKKLLVEIPEKFHNQLIGDIQIAFDEYEPKVQKVEVVDIDKKFVDNFNGFGGKLGLPIYVSPAEKSVLNKLNEKGYKLILIKP